MPSNPEFKIYRQLLVLWFRKLNKIKTNLNLFFLERNIELNFKNLFDNQINKKNVTVLKVRDGSQVKPTNKRTKIQVLLD